MTIAKIDFAELYRQHMRRGNRAPKPASAWDARAKDMSRKVLHSNYVDDFIKRMDLRGASTLLDVGCGPGTVCLPLAAGMQRVYGLDYSKKMLDCLMANAKARHLDNVVPLRCAWEDDWSQVPVCDIAIASRSTAPISASRIG
ncbi:MAG: class I SAM-dependent methyltransferase, partial [Pollutimonas bauzanensis]